MLRASHGCRTGRASTRLPSRFQDAGAIGQVILALAVVVLQLVEGVEQVGAGEDVRAHVHFGDSPLLVGGVLFLDDALKLAGRVADDPAQARGIWLVQRAQQARRLVLREVGRAACGAMPPASAANRRRRSTTGPA